jgi:hypothetical protein
VADKPRNLQIYSNAYVFINSNLLAQEASVTVEKKGNAVPMFTLAMGFAGLSQGAGTIEISIENAVPTSDFEFNPDLFIRTNSVVEVGIAMASRQLIVKGFLTDATYSHSVNDSSKLSMKLICRYADFE